jgi:hypothetical protein
MIRQLCISVCLALVSAAIPLCAANRPHAGAESQKTKVWTNDDLEKLHDVCVISIVGQVDEGKSVSEPARRNHEVIQNPEWYAEHDELESRQAQLREYRQAVDDARSLRESGGGINRAGEDFAITPEAGIEILQHRVNEVQAKLDDLEDLARRNDIPPGTLRGQ